MMKKEEDVNTSNNNLNASSSNLNASSNNLINNLNNNDKKEGGSSIIEKMEQYARQHGIKVIHAFEFIHLAGTLDMRKLIDTFSAGNAKSAYMATAFTIEGEKDDILARIEAALASSQNPPIVCKVNRDNYRD